jgi:hypothetical protein
MSRNHQPKRQQQNLRSLDLSFFAGILKSMNVAAQKIEAF